MCEVENLHLVRTCQSSEKVRELKWMPDGGKGRGTSDERMTHATQAGDYARAYCSRSPRTTSRFLKGIVPQIQFSSAL
eukprot:6203198-Pleurochrysis_carterae.AAC.6